MTRMTLLITLILAGCSPSSGGQSHGSDSGHSHGGHSHGGDGGHAPHEDEGASVAITRWTDAYELFVELDAPVAGGGFGYHAHVTRLADNHAVETGTLTLRFEQDGFAVESHTDPSVARPGIFSATATAPATAGTYELIVSWVDGAERADWSGADVQVGAETPIPHGGGPTGTIAFLKEAQWQVPFATAVAQERALAPVIRAPAVVRPAPGSTTVVAAPTDGLLAWTDALPVVGRRVTRGERVATLIPAGAAEHWAQLQADLAKARIDLELAVAERDRVEGLAAEGLLPTRRRAEAQAAVDRAEADVRAWSERATALTSGSSSAVAIRAPAAGLVVSVGAEHGDSVTAGSMLVTVASTGAVLLEGHVHDRHRGTLQPVQTLTVERGDWDGPRDLLALGATVLTEELVFDPHALSAPLSVRVPAEAGLVVGDLVELTLGVPEPEVRLVVPRTAVVETSGLSVVFVQESGESFSRRRVVLGTADADDVEVLSGVEVGERVVSRGGFDVHVASLSGALESHTH